MKWNEEIFIFSISVDMENLFLYLCDKNSEWIRSFFMITQYPKKVKCFVNLSWICYQPYDSTFLIFILYNCSMCKIYHAQLNWMKISGISMQILLFLGKYLNRYKHDLNKQSYCNTNRNNMKIKNVVVKIVQCKTSEWYFID